MNVRHAEKFYTAGVTRVWVFWQSTGPIIGIREPTPFMWTLEIIAVDGNAIVNGCFQFL